MGEAFRACSERHIQLSMIDLCMLQRTEEQARQFHVL